MTIEKKIWPEYFDKVLSGEKTYELRLADFDCQPGDILILKEWEPQTKAYSGRELRKEVTYTIKTKDINFWPIEDVEKYGYQIISFK
ncbi:MAG: DUF3850 domain-containing protein [Patescibacteria group bacterium]